MTKIGIIGNGFVGSAIAAGFGLHSEIKVYDKQPNKSIDTFQEVLNCDFVFVCLPSPMDSNNHGMLDLSIIDSVFEQISNQNRRNDNIFIIKSTVTPGTTDKYIEQYPNLNIIFNPEFLTERAARLDFINSSRIVLGGQEHNLKKVYELYRDRFPFVKIVVTDTKSAEFIKYMCNCFFATKISFMNEMKQLSDALSLDWEDIMNGFVSDGRIGNSHLDVPGHDGMLGFGGKCFPKDINAFINYFEQNDVEPTVLKAAWKKNLQVRERTDWNDIEGAVTKNER
jgi:nucleotide sugar dehydrogenase